jgi:transcription antitermination factor NusA-like protein/predicted RNA-binding protein YlxR (DUF448 family)
MRKLFAQEVPEIYDGIIEIKAAARDPGSRAKIGVISHDSSIDPVGACVGMKGSRVQAVVQEMQGEKIDIIPWSPDLATFVVNALQPATVARVVIDEEESRIEVVVPDDQLSLAIGRRGQNVRLASQLTGSAIDIMTEADASEKRQREFIERSEMFQNELDVDETLAQLLVAEASARWKKSLMSSWTSSLDRGLRRGSGERAQSRAQEALERREEAAREERRGPGVEDELAEMPYLTEAMLVTLGKAGIRRSTILPISPPTSSSPRRSPSSAASASPTGRRTRAAFLPNTASPTSRVTRSSWPPAPTGSRTKTAQAGRTLLRKPPNETRAKLTHPSPSGEGKGVGVVENAPADVTSPTPTPPLKGRGSHVPERTCILTRTHGTRDSLIRLALGPDGQVLPDVRAKAPGRGAWIGVDRKTLEAAQAKGKLKGALSRAFKTGELAIPTICRTHRNGAAPGRARPPRDWRRARALCSPAARRSPPRRGPARSRFCSTRRMRRGRKRPARPGLARRQRGRACPRSGFASTKVHIVVSARPRECGTYRAD